MFAKDADRGFGRDSIILASGSPTRRAMLEEAGVPVRVIVSAIDERAIESAVVAAGSRATTIAEALADAKAEEVSRRIRKAYVIGADQTLDCEGTKLHKPDDASAAERQLRFLSGRTHVLRSAVAIYRGAQPMFRAVGVARLTMRKLGEEEIQSYIQSNIESIRGCVGAYRIEGAGIELFQDIDGDRSVIMGMPLSPLLDFLRSAGLIL